MPLFFASDTCDAAHPTVIDGSRDLIARRDHREAIIWLAAAYSRRQKSFHQDAPAGMEEWFELDYRDLLADLGAVSFADLAVRGCGGIATRCLGGGGGRHGGKHDNETLSRARIARA